MIYEENEYWNNRMKVVGYLNNPNGTTLSNVEREYYEKYLFPGARVLDYGAGDGKLMPLFEKYKCNVLFYDIVPEFKELLNQRYISLNCTFPYLYMTQKAYTPIYTNYQFDIICCASVLMHVRIEKMPLILKEMKRLSGSGNVVCSAYENKEERNIHMDSHNFNHDYEKIFLENKLTFKEYVYKNKIAFFAY